MYALPRCATVVFRPTTEPSLEFTASSTRLMTVTPIAYELFEPRWWGVRMAPSGVGGVRGRRQTQRPTFPEGSAMFDRDTRRSSGVSIISVLIVVWLLIGVLAAAQRDYFSGSNTNCAKVGTITVTILAGPLNYLGANPKIKCHTPQPSK
jgi:hypothetical protein